LTIISQNRNKEIKKKKLNVKEDGLWREAFTLRKNFNYVLIRVYYTSGKIIIKLV
jgi:hypothetical protein